MSRCGRSARSEPGWGHRRSFSPWYIYERLLGKPDLERRFATRRDDLAGRAEGLRQRIADHHEDRAARLAPLPHPLELYAGTYESPVEGTMTWRVVAGGLEMRQGVMYSRAEVYDATTDRFRVELAGRCAVVEFTFPATGGPAESVSMYGASYVRTGSNE